MDPNLNEMNVAEDHLKESLEVMYSDIYKKLCFFVILFFNYLNLDIFEISNGKVIYVQQIVVKI